MIKRTKIICSIGPASSSPQTIQKLLENGMDAARINFSHGSPEEHAETIQILKKMREEYQRPLAIIADTRGPEIRTGLTEGDRPIMLAEGADVIVTTRDSKVTPKTISVSYPKLPTMVRPGAAILLANGQMELRVEALKGKNIHCTVLQGGILTSKKSVNLPGTHTDLPTLTALDKSELEKLVGDIDYIAASFIRSAKAVEEVREFLKACGGEKIKIISKIENFEGIENLDRIIAASDGIMVARGDLGVELPLEDIPNLQKQIIRRCFGAGKPAIVATEMLESMIEKSRPTRAEVSDVANAVHDLASAVMLSAETASGRHPAEAVEIMARIIRKAEAAVDYPSIFMNPAVPKTMDITDSISHAAVRLSYELDASALACLTKTGCTARMISRWRPSSPILGLTPDPVTCNQLALNWGVLPSLLPETRDLEELFEKALASAKNEMGLKSGDVVILTAGAAPGRAGTTNLVKAEIVSD
jgi:pyruvate kinase